MDNKRPIEDVASRKESSEVTEEEEREKQEIKVCLGHVFYQIVRLQNLLRGPIAPTTSDESSKQ